MKKQAMQHAKQIHELTLANHELTRKVKQSQDLPQRKVAALERIADALETVTQQMDKSGIMVNLCTNWGRRPDIPRPCAVRDG